MTDDLSHAEIQELLGAVALDAVDGRERVIIEAHVETCETCRAELDDHRRLARALKRHGSRVSPLVSTELNGSASTSKAERPRPARRWEIPVAVAIIFVILGGLFAQAQVRFDDVEARMDRLELLGRAQLATTDPAAIVTALRTPGGDSSLTVVSRPGGGGTSYALNSALPPLGDAQTYVLWRIDSTGVTSVATLGRRPNTVGFPLPAGVTGFLLTVETGPTPSRPTLPAVATGRVVP